jgi:cytochrome b561
VSTATHDEVEDAVQPAQFTRLSRILHWLTAVLIFTALLVGFTMVSTIGDYATLLAVHKTLGAVILVVVIVRVVNRLTHRAPALPGTVGRFERLGVFASELALYGLLLAQPLVGWAMVSASGTPVVVFGSVHLPAIAPTSLQLYSILREAHSILAYLFVAIIAAHVSAILLHTITLGDGMLRRMTFNRKRQ